MAIKPEPELPELGCLYLLELIELEEKFSVAKGGKEEGKDVAAMEALRTVAMFAERYAGWALRHHAGRGKALATFVPLGPTKLRDMPFYQEARDEADSHQWELSGEAIFSELKWTKATPDPLDRPAVQRFMLWNVLHPMMRYLFPSRLSSKLTEAFDLALHDAANPFFSIRSRRQPYELRRLQLRAIGHRVFRSGIGPVKDAEEAVAEAYVIKVETLQGWPTKLRQHEDFGELEVARVIAFAENHASYVHAYNKRTDHKIKATDRRTQLFLQTHMAPYTDELLREEGAAYHEMDSHPKSKLVLIPKPKNKK